jgi:hypothetical protein
VDDDMILCALCPTLLPRAETEYSEYHEGYLCAECLALVNGDSPDERDDRRPDPAAGDVSRVRGDAPAGPARPVGADLPDL